MSQGVAAYICLPKTAWPPTCFFCVSSNSSVSWLHMVNGWNR
ncbi:hypothetical protein PTB13_12860 [Bacillus sp. MHSD17]|nr:hypothetical protein [Bacillus sp. MHSD17]